MEKEPIVLGVLDKVLIPIIIAAITYIIAKKQITNSSITQFRQKWIDDLRNCISIYIAKAEMISMLDLNDDEQYFKHFKELSQMQNKIALMLNPLEKDHNQLIEITEEIRELIHDEDVDDEELEKRLDKKIAVLLDVSKIVLKKEWNVIKKGK